MCMDVKRTCITGAALAHIIGSSPLNPEHLVPANGQPGAVQHLVAAKETRQGLYGTYEVDSDSTNKNVSLCRGRG